MRSLPSLWLLSVLLLLGSNDSHGQTAELSKQGNHLTLIEEVGTASESKFLATVELYSKHLAQFPGDVIAATERCRFIDYFSYAEDYYFEETDRLLEESEAYLDRFDKAPEVELYRFENIWGEEAISHGKTLLADRSIKFSNKQRAAIHLQLAQNHYYQDFPREVGQHARSAHEGDPSVQSQLTLARHLNSVGANQEALEVLEQRFPEETAHQKSMRMNLLSELGDNEGARVVLKELRETEDGNLYLSALVTAGIYAEVGQLEEAQEAYEEALENEWQRDRVLLELFDFEKKHGDADTSLAAYRRLRDDGFWQDPVLYNRLRLLGEHPSLPWQWRDLLGVLFLAAIFLAITLIPLLWTLPVHYWGLIRQTKGKESRDEPPGWNLKHSWLVFSIYLFISLLLNYIFAYDATWKTFFSDAFSEVEIPSLPLARMMLLDGILFLLVIGFVISFRKIGQAFSHSHWSIRRCIGFGALAYLPVRFIAALNSQFFGGAELVSAAEITLTQTAIFAILEQYGALVLIFSLAVITPIVEEIIFRGVLLTSFLRHIPFWPANLLQAVLFAAIHEQYTMFPFYFAFGIIAGILREKSGSLLPSIVLHAINNALASLGVIALNMVQAPQI